jgi:hypothetical protein
MLTSLLAYAHSCPRDDHLWSSDFDFCDRPDRPLISMTQTRSCHIARRWLGLECSYESAQLEALKFPRACVMPVRGIKVHQRNASVIVDDDVPRLDVSVRHAAEVDSLQNCAQFRPVEVDHERVGPRGPGAGLAYLWSRERSRHDWAGRPRYDTANTRRSSRAPSHLNSP